MRDKTWLREKVANAVYKGAKLVPKKILEDLLDACRFEKMPDLVKSLENLLEEKEASGRIIDELKSRKDGIVIVSKQKRIRRTRKFLAREEKIKRLLALGKSEIIEYRGEKVILAMVEEGLVWIKYESSGKISSVDPLDLKIKID